MKNIPTDVSYLSLEEQLRELKDEHTCTVCTDREISIVLILCGHEVVYPFPKKVSLFKRYNQGDC